MKTIWRHFRRQVGRGFLVAVPFVLCVFVVLLIYQAAETKLTIRIEKLLGVPVPGLGIVLVVVFLYLLGLLSSNWLGRRVLRLLEKLAERIPVVKTVYHLGKQLSTGLSLPEHGAFQRVVMLESFQAGVWSVGFVTGETRKGGRGGEKFLKVFIPTAPNPTAGFLVMVRESRVRDLDWSVPEAFNSIISAGLAGPTALNRPRRSQTSTRKRRT